jgi:hypothetical protein
MNNRTKSSLITMQGHQPTFVSVDEEIIREAIVACDAAIENTNECLHSLKSQNSYRQKREKFVTESYEKDLIRLSSVRKKLRKLLGWPEV